ncbi:YutD family protein [Latilactobacillus fuchuensis]|uniref:Transcriptional regulator n=1 Tax=Latilactobacillus fuchuensis DSM 14340 = JCM 11249 TaxID=1423747 RepID=A0A0R1S2S0_9LACO|nr:YutD family protein [Latilactobacillus fuchuensis]KRL60994.1 hypothetical protein FC69_GL001008 [Latilactobacillus fuchuensis DSM 14340 = JCM 11249]MCP8856636.1 YutD family protein [Latilactobacillus fuchuensis]
MTETKPNPKLTKKVTQALAKETESTPTEKQPEVPQHVVAKSETMLEIDKCAYEVVVNYRDGYQPEKLNERYNDVLAKYDYIVADWGFEQLRLRGFYKTTNRRANKDQLIDTLEDYLYEYCNFGCPYFVIERQGKPIIKNENRRHNNRQRNSQKRRRQQKPGFTERQVVDSQKVVKEQPKKAVTTNKKSVNKRHFKIRPLESDTKK